MDKLKNGNRVLAGGIAFTIAACGVATGVSQSATAAPSETKTWTLADAGTGSEGVKTTAGYNVDGITDVRLTSAYGYENADSSAPKGYWAWGITSGSVESGKDDSKSSIPSTDSPISAYAMALYGDAAADDAVTNAAVAFIAHMELDTGNALVSPEQRQEMWSRALETAPDEVKDKVSEIKKSFENYQKVGDPKQATVTEVSEGVIKVTVPEGSSAKVKITGEAAFSDNGEKEIEVDKDSTLKIEKQSFEDDDKEVSYNVTVDPDLDSFKKVPDSITAYQQNGKPQSGNSDSYEKMVYAAPTVVKLENASKNNLKLSAVKAEPSDPTPTEPSDPKPSDPTPSDPKPSDPDDSQSPSDPKDDTNTDSPTAPDAPSDNSKENNKPVVPKAPPTNVDDVKDGVKATVSAFDKSDGDTYFPYSGGTIVTQFNAEGLRIGETYTVTSKLIDMTASQQAGKTIFLKDSNGKDVTVSQKAYVGQDGLMAKVEFNVEKNAAGREFTPFYQLSDSSGKIVASYGNVESTSNVLKFAASEGKVETKVVYKNDSKLSERVTYKNLVPDEDYNLNVSVLNEKGDSVFNKEIKFKTNNKGVGDLNQIIELPKDLEPGKYTVLNEITDSDGTVIAQATGDTFKFEKKDMTFEEYVKEKDKNSDKSKNDEGNRKNSRNSENRNSRTSESSRNSGNGSSSNNGSYGSSQSSAHGYNSGAMVKTGGEAVEKHHNNSALTVGVIALIAALAASGGAIAVSRKRKSNSEMQ